jgi:hypothetical protein
MRTRLLLSLLAAGVMLAAPELAGSSARATSPVAPASIGFDHLKALAGNWQFKAPDGKITRASYEVDAAGTAVVEKLQSEGEQSMVTVYYPDGVQVMLTHYCTLGNHPRMRTTGAGSNDSLSFVFVDATNMKNADDAHMHGLKFTVADRDHFSQTWTMKKDGKEIPLTFSFERAK